jgi:hypothetical protein
MNKEFIKKVAEIQKHLKAHKSQRNTFGNYNYRNQEDILEAVKPLLSERELVLTISDEIVSVQDSIDSSRVYVKATAILTDGENSISNTAFARESLDKKGMDSSQITGATSSYARKYALNGLFLIDDTKDADSMDNNKEEKSDKTPTEKNSTPDGNTTKPTGSRFRRGAK